MAADNFENCHSPFTSISSLVCIFLQRKFPSKRIKVAFQYGPVPKQDQESVPKEDQESLSAPYLDCVCMAGASSWSCSTNPNRTRNLSLLLLCTFSTRQASLSGQLVYPFTGPLCYSSFSVKSCSDPNGALV